MASPALSDSQYGNYIWINGERHEVRHHPSDFTILDPEEVLPGLVDFAELTVRRRSPQVALVTANGDRDTAMDYVRRLRPAYHVYLAKPLNGDFTPNVGEILITDRLILMLNPNDPALLDALSARFHLERAGLMGDAYVLRITASSGGNTLKTANRIAELRGVTWCEPERLFRFKRQDGAAAPSLPKKPPVQWYLSLGAAAPQMPYGDAGIDLPGAWEVTRGSPDVVVAVIDDGFVLDHPVFQNTSIDPAKFNFPGHNANPAATKFDDHGTPVASIAAASAGGVMLGVAPGCSFLPIRINVSELVSPQDLLSILDYVSRHADVAVFTAASVPSITDYFNSEFRRQVSQYMLTGGKRGRGLVFVVSAGNYDAPTHLAPQQNTLGVAFPDQGQITVLPPGNPVFSDFASLDGTIVAAAHTSFKRKAGYSNWGPNITVSAPSNNFHEIDIALRAAATPDPRFARFRTRYPGSPVLAACNRNAVAKDFPPLPDDPRHPGVFSLYTAEFGGTSAAAPLVAGAAALMLSVNSSLTAAEVRDILAETASQDLNPKTIPDPDPNLQGMSAAFANGRSICFGAGRLNCALAVRHAGSYSRSKQDRVPIDLLPQND